jgi:hypothetical protein
LFKPAKPEVAKSESSEEKNSMFSFQPDEDVFMKTTEEVNLDIGKSDK